VTRDPPQRQDVPRESKLAVAVCVQFVMLSTK